MTTSLALREDDLWAKASRDSLQRMTDLARRVLKARFAILSTFIEDRQVVLCHSGMPEDWMAAPLDETPCHITRMSEMAIVARSVREHPLLGTVKRPECIVSYLGVPIRLDDGLVAGTFCVADADPHDWSDDDLDLIGEMAACLASQIELDLENTRRERAETALREGQARFSIVADNIPALVFERRKVDASGATYTFFGSSKADTAVSRLMADLGFAGDLAFVHGDDRENVRAALLRSTVEETDLDLTFRVLWEDGSVRWLRSQALVRRGAVDGGVCWDGICFDISDLVAARESADAARGVREAVLVDVSHELRAPLQAIVGFSDFLTIETRPDVVAAHAKNIGIATHSVLAIVNQLLDTAGAKAAGTIESIALREFAEACLSLIGPIAVEKALTTELVIEDGSPVTFAADSQKLQQALLNLLNNAIKFTDVGTITLRIGLSAGALRFNVIDTGIGIKDEERDRLFQRFSRIDRSPSSRDGTGLGLAITKILVEGMDGTIGVKSNAGPGTTFWFDIPFAPAPPATEPAAVASGPDGSEQVEAGAGARILLADDLDLNRKLISDMLSIEGYVVDCVADGAAAVKAASESRYDLILMDMIMPGMDGVAATRAIRALKAPAGETPIVALTANSFRDQLDACLSAGMDGTLTKPMSMDALTQAVFAWTRGRTKAA